MRACRQQAKRHNQRELQATSDISMTLNRASQGVQEHQATTREQDTMADKSDHKCEDCSMELAADDLRLDDDGVPLSSFPSTTGLVPQGP